jgi:glycosyltransferase involved in cell wall biosynthesis
MFILNNNEKPSVRDLMPIQKPAILIQAVRSMHPVGGVSRVAFQLASAFQKQGLHTETVTGELPKNQFADVDVGELYEIRSVAWLTHHLSGYLQVNLTVMLFSLMASQFLRTRSHESVTFSHGDSFTGDIIVAHSCHWAAIHTKVKNRQWRWIFNPMHWFVLGREAWVMRRSRFWYLIAVSRSIAEEYQHYHHISLDKIKIIPNGVDTNQFSHQKRPVSRQSVLDELNLSENTFILIFVGNEFRRKGLAYIIQALSLFNAGDREIILLVLGRDNPTPYKRIAQKKRVLDNVHFLNARPDVERYMAAADLFILPTDYEAFPLVCIEAMASGTPVLTTRTGGMAEYLKDNINGLFIKRDPEDIADKISSLLNDPARRRSMGIEARKTAEKFDWELIASRYIEVINDLAREKKAGKDRC